MYITTAHKQITERLAKDLSKVISKIWKEKWFACPEYSYPEDLLGDDLITPQQAAHISHICHAATEYWLSLEQSPAAKLALYTKLVEKRYPVESEEVICEGTEADVCED